MSRIRVQFRMISQDSQDAHCSNPSDEHMASRLKFDMEMDGQRYPGLVVDVRQPFGTNYATEPIEVGLPQGIGSHPFPHDLFSDAAEKYYRSFASPGVVGSPSGGERKFRNNIVEKASEIFEFEFPGTTGGWQLGGGAPTAVTESFPPDVERVEGQTFVEKDVILSGYYYVDCTFRKCRFIYSGEGGGGIDASCKFEHPFSLALVGPAQNTIHFLRLIYHNMPDVGPTLVEKFIDDIRKPFATGT